MGEFEEQLIAALPRLKRQARALAGDRSVAEDLVQDAVCSALVAKARFIPGSNMEAWTYRILRNLFVSYLRKSRNTISLDEAPSSALTVGPAQDQHVRLCETLHSIGLRSLADRALLDALVVRDLSCQVLGQATRVPDGTIKSRIWRIRRRLEHGIPIRSSKSRPRRYSAAGRDGSRQSATLTSVKAAHPALSRVA